MWGCRMLCVHCGQRETTEAVFYIRGELEPAPGTPAPQSLIQVARAQRGTA